MSISAVGNPVNGRSVTDIVAKLEKQLVKSDPPVFTGKAYLYFSDGTSGLVYRWRDGLQYNEFFPVTAGQ